MRAMLKETFKGKVKGNASEMAKSKPLTENLPIKKACLINCTFFFSSHNHKLGIVF